MDVKNIIKMEINSIKKRGYLSPNDLLQHGKCRLFKRDLVIFLFFIVEDFRNLTI